MRFSELLNQDGKIDWTHVCHLIHVLGTNVQDGEYQIANYFIDEIKDNGDIMTKAIAFDRDNLKFCSNRLLDDEPFLRRQLSVHINFKHISERLQNKRNFVEDIVLNDVVRLYDEKGKDKYSIPAWVYSDKELLFKAIKQAYINVRYANRSLVNSEGFIDELLSVCPESYCYLNADVKYDQEKFFKALSIKDTSVYPKNYQGEWTEEMIDALIENHYSTCFHNGFDLILVNPSRVLRVLKRAPLMVKHLPQSFKNTINHYKRLKGFTDSVEAYEYAITIKEMRTQKREITATIGSKGRAKKSEPAQTVSNTVRRL